MNAVNTDFHFVDAARGEAAKAVGPPIAPATGSVLWLENRGRTESIGWKSG
jgi:hypothetical protein